jgi:hypothetical protein
MLFTDRAIWTMVHGIVLGGGALLGLAAALYGLSVAGPASALPEDQSRQARAFAWLNGAIALLLWTAVITGTYIIFPPYRATPPPGTTDLTAFPRSLIQSNPDTRWLHAFAMEFKEHAPWIAAMLSTAVAFVSISHRETLFSDRDLSRLAMAFLAIAFALVGFVTLMGTFVNKVAPLF